MPITQFHVGLARTIVPPDGDRYQPVKLDAGLIWTLEPGEDEDAARATAQVKLRALLEETYRAQVRPPKPVGTPDPPPGQRFAPADPATAPTNQEW